MKQNKNSKCSLSSEILAEAMETLEKWEQEDSKQSAALRPKKQVPAASTRPQSSSRRTKDNPPAEQPPRKKFPCPVAHKCGGCQLQNLSYPEQLRWKQGKAERLLKEFGRVSPIIGMENPRHYRNKVQAAFGMARDKKIISGVWQSSTHRIVQIDSCMIEDQKADEIIVSIRKLMKDFKMTSYNEVTQEGFLRHVLVRRAFATGEIMVVMVTATPIFPAKRNFVRALLKLHPEITTIIHNICKLQVNLVLGDREESLYGKGTIEDILCGKRFRISSRSFYQVNPVQTEVLYRKAIEFAGLTGKETILDAYCGIGTIGIAASDQAERVIGVELNPSAVRDAAANAALNQISNIDFAAGDAGEFMEELADAGENVDVVFLDPPRAGSDEKFLRSLVRLGPPKVVYISCNPETLARDLKFLVRNGYSVRAIQPVDMFPFTS
ncbi:MAG: 23S rRNA (uracil(1939)-C(5))-methyltransferase RlmD, partial [Candidatus Merdivicinus sp.]